MNNFGKMLKLCLSNCYCCLAKLNIFRKCDLSREKGDASFKFGGDQMPLVSTSSKVGGVMSHGALSTGCAY